MDFTEFKAFDNLNTEIIILDGDNFQTACGSMMQQKQRTGLVTRQNLLKAKPFPLYLT